MSKSLLMKSLLFVSLTVLTSTGWAQDPTPPAYVGAETCMGCHEREHRMFSQYARKSKSFESIQKMKKGLTPEEISGCYACHTTGYGRPGGFISPEKTPSLKNAGCEVCHGPGGRHVKSYNSKDISRKVTLEVCRQCHTEERIANFRYRPLLHGGAH